MGSKLQDSTHATLRVLVADDSAEIAKRVASLLVETGLIAVVGPARDGEEALALYQDQLPDVVILDFAMPRMGGLDALRAIRAGGGTCLAIILTAHSDPSVRDACIAAGADHFLSKASDADQIVAILMAYIEARRP